METKATIKDSLKLSNQNKGTVLAEVKGPKIDQSLRLEKRLAEREKEVGADVSDRVNTQVKTTTKQDTSWNRLGNSLRTSRTSRRKGVSGRQCVSFSVVDPLEKCKLGFDRDLCSISSRNGTATAVVSLAGEQIQILINTGASV